MIYKLVDGFGDIVLTNKDNNTLTKEMVTGLRPGIGGGGGVRRKCRGGGDGLEAWGSTGEVVACEEEQKILFLPFFFLIYSNN